MKLSRFFAALFLVVFFAGILQAGEPVSFSWAFFLKDTSGQLRSMSFEDAEPVEGGDLLRIYLELHQRSHVYLYLFDARQDLYLVFPPGPRFYSGYFPVWHKFYIPSGRDWFTLDGTKGVERFYLLASNDRLVELEEMTSRFLDNGNDELKGQLLALIEKKVQDLSRAPGVEIDRIPVLHSQSLSGQISPPEVVANRISATGNYGMILDLVNR
jgi:hypothetical protein